MRPVILVVLLLAWPAFAEPGPRPPCGTSPSPPFAALDDPPAIRVWTRAEVSGGWRIPSCLGWTAPDFTLLVALAGRLRFDGGTDQLLARFGAISSLVGVRFWSTEDRRWEGLFRSAAAIDGPDSRRHRADFTADEMKSGRDLYFVQRDNDTSVDVIYRMRVRAAAPDRLVVEMVNVTPVRWFVFRLFAPGDLHPVYLLRRRSGNVWDYYNLLRVGSGASARALSNYAPYVNRVEAIFRHFAGIPTDRDPPAMR